MRSAEPQVEDWTAHGRSPTLVRSLVALETIAITPSS